MNTENTQEAAPVVEALNTTAVPTEEPEIVEPGSTDSEASDGDESEAKPEKTAEQKEIERLRRSLTKRDRTQGKMHQELQSYRQQLEARQVQQGESSPAQYQQPHIDPIALAREIATIERVNEKSNRIAEDGNKRYPNFTESLVKVVEEVGNLFNERGHPTAVGEALLESDDMPALVDFLGKNPDLAADLEGLSPTKLGRQIERIEAQMKTTRPKPVSRASEPISPIKGGKGNVVKTLENMSMTEYKAARAKQGAKWAR